MSIDIDGARGKNTKLEEKKYEIISRYGGSRMSKTDRNNKKKILNT